MRSTSTVHALNSINIQQTDPASYLTPTTVVAGGFGEIISKSFVKRCNEVKVYQPIDFANEFKMK